MNSLLKFVLTASCIANIVFAFQSTGKSREVENSFYEIKYHYNKLSGNRYMLVVTGLLNFQESESGLL